MGTPPLPWAAWSNALNAAREVASTTSVGSLFQCLTTLRVRNVFLIANLNLPSFNLKPLPLVLSLHALVKRSSPFKGVSLILPPSSSSVKQEITLLNAEEIVTVCLFVYLCFLQ